MVCILPSECHNTRHSIGTYGLYSPIRVSQYQAFNRYIWFVFSHQSVTILGIQSVHKVCILPSECHNTRHSIGTYGLYSPIRVSQYQAFNRYIWSVFYYQSVIILGIQSVHMVCILHQSVIILGIQLVHMVCILPSECHNTRHSIIWFVFYYQSVTILGIQSVHMVCILLSECHNTRHSIGTYGLYSPIRVSQYQAFNRYIWFVFSHQSVTILGIQSVHMVCILPSECHNTRHSIGTYGLYSPIRVSQYQAFNRYIRFVFSHQSVTILGIQSVHMVCILPSECHNTRHSIGT